eukprot:scpid44284/ scgid32321/ 
MVRDAHNNPSRAIPATRALLVTTYTGDVSTPRLVSFDVNMTAAQVVFTFSETVKSGDLKATAVTFLDGARTGGGKTYQLKAGTPSTVSSTIVTLTLASSDVDALAAIDNLVSAANTTYVTLTADLVSDIAGRPLQAVTTGVRVRNFTADSVSPKLLTYTFDMNAGTVMLNFDEVVRVSSLSAAAARVSLSDQTLPQSLVGSTAVAGSTNAKSVVLALSLAVLNAIKLEQRLAISQDTTYLNLTASFISDMHANALQALTAVRRADTYRSDLVRPSLAGFTLVGATGDVELTFSEPVDASTMNISGLVLHNAANQSTSSFR